MADVVQLPGLIKQEREALQTHLQIMFKLHFSPKGG